MGAHLFHYRGVIRSIRAPFAIFMLTPLPLLKGLTVLQALGMLAVSASIGLADTVWTSFSGYIPANTKIITLDSTMAQPRNDLVNAVLINNTVMIAVPSINPKITADPKWTCERNGLNVWQSMCTYAVQSGDGTNASYGSVSVSCGQDAKGLIDTVVKGYLSIWLSMTTLVTNSVVNAVAPDPSTTQSCIQKQNLVTKLYKDTEPAARAIVEQGLNGTKISGAGLTAMDTASKDLGDGLNAIVTDVNQSTGGFNSTVQSFADGSAKAGWMSSVMFYPVLSSMISAAQAVIDSAMPTAKLADLNADPYQAFGVPTSDMAPIYAALNAYRDSNPMNNATVKNLSPQAQMDVSVRPTHLF